MYCNIDSCDGIYKAVASEKGHSKRSYCIQTTKFNNRRTWWWKIETKECKLWERCVLESPPQRWSKDFHYPSNKRRKWQTLTPKTKVNSLTKTKKLLNMQRQVIKPGVVIWFFSDEKNFCHNQEHNTQGSSWVVSQLKASRLSEKGRDVILSKSKVLDKKKQKKKKKKKHWRPKW